MPHWRGLKALVHDAVDATTALVAEGHDSAHRGVRRVAERTSMAAGVGLVQDAVRLGTTSTLVSVQVVNRVVESLTDLALDASVEEGTAEAPILALRSDVLGSTAWIADAALGAVNGSIGDHLHRTGNALDLGLQLRRGDRYLGDDDAADLQGTVVVLVHGLGTTEWCWALDAEAYHGDAAATFGELLARDAGVHPVFVRYNTGRRVVDSGRSLAAAIERHVAAPGVERVVLLGHSMGGLVARAACEAAREDGHTWLSKVDLVITLGSPHQGAPLARFGQVATTGLGGVDLPTSRILSRILAARSAGVRDLEHGDIGDVALDPDASAAPEDRVVPLLDGITYAFLAATITADPDHVAGRWLGDLLVQAGSASRPARHDTFPIQTGTFPAVKHHQLQCHPAVYAHVRALIE